MVDYLAFVDEIGRTTDGQYIYRFDFSVDKDIVWGEFFNVAPSAIIPDLQPDKNTLSRAGRVIFPIEMAIAKRNYCFSMQDCIDGIIPLIFSEIGEDTIEYEGKPLSLNFGMEFEEVVKILDSVNIKITDLEEVEKGDDSAIDALIDSMDDNDDDMDPDEF